MNLTKLSLVATVSFILGVATSDIPKMFASPQAHASGLQSDKVVIHKIEVPSTIAEMQQVKAGKNFPPSLIEGLAGAEVVGFSCIPGPADPGDTGWGICYLATR